MLQRVQAADGRDLLVRREGDAVAVLGPWDGGRILDAVPDAAAERLDAAGTTPLPFLREGAKILCVGLNYRPHIEEMGREAPEYPTLFAKFVDSFVGPADDIVRPADVDQLDWEGEIGVIIGTEVRSASVDGAAGAALGAVALNDVTSRGHQYRTTQWLQGKALDSLSPIGSMVAPLRDDLTIETRVDGETVQQGRLDELVFGVADLIAYCSSIVRLRPGDVIATGTPGGVGHGMQPPRHLQPGQLLETELGRGGSSIETLCNRVRDGAEARQQ
ncbi:fumarylacetoacetate hydrolase family protein [Agrococcus sp. TF02-05]|uniref:fumarylacetoacetate hydrolase family protein n=1 Tax=Agrococcus sp. TF02-05 TaxID=2815211 RepID=UPI001FB698DB|nr:fumarylacetoacetate hydrolase family protein [Agrococcus sp. TF02-05]